MRCGPYSDGIRQRRRQAAEEMAAKTTVKIIFPLVLFIFPSIFIVLLGPAILSLMRGMDPASANKGLRPPSFQPPLLAKRPETPMNYMCATEASPAIHRYQARIRQAARRQQAALEGPI